MKNNIIFFLLIILSFFVMGCTDLHIQLHLNSDGSALYQETFNFTNHIEMSIKHGLYEEDVEELKEMFHQDSKTCENFLEEKTKDSKYLLLNCETFNYGINAFSYLKENSFPIKKEDEIYKYRLRDFIEYFDILDPSVLIEDGVKTSFVINFEGIIIQTNIGIIEENSVKFNSYDLIKAFQEHEDPIIKAEINPSEKITINEARKIISQKKYNTLSKNNENHINQGILFLIILIIISGIIFYSMKNPKKEVKK